MRRMLGKPAKTMHFALKGETEVDWRFALPATSPKLFTVVHGPDQRVLRTYTGDEWMPTRTRAAADRAGCAAGF